MPAFTEDNLRHLLRRTEFVVRPERLAALQASGSLAAAVDDVLDIGNNPVRAAPGPVPVFRQVQWHRRQRFGRRRVDPVPRGCARWIDYAARGTSTRGPGAPAMWRAPAGEDGAVLARASRVVLVADPSRRALDVANPWVPARGSRKSGRHRPGDGRVAGDARLPLQRLQRRRRTQPELRPRVDGAVHARRRQLQRGRRRRRRPRLVRAQLRLYEDQRYVYSMLPTTTATRRCSAPRGRGTARR